MTTDFKYDVLVQASVCVECIYFNPRNKGLNRKNGK